MDSDTRYYKNNYRIQMKIKTLGNKIRIKIPANSAGGLNLDSMTTAVEYGEVIDIGDLGDSSPFSIGDTILFKAWAIDIIDYEGEKYYFLDLSKIICSGSDVSLYEWKSGLPCSLNPKPTTGSATISGLATTPLHSKKTTTQSGYFAKHAKNK